MANLPQPAMLTGIGNVANFLRGQDSPRPDRGCGSEPFRQEADALQRPRRVQGNFDGGEAGLEQYLAHRLGFFGSDPAQDGNDVSRHLESPAICE